MIKFSVINLDSTGIELSGTENQSFLELHDSDILAFNKPVEYQLHASQVNNGILVKGRVSVKADAKCGKCLEPFTLDIKNDDVCIFVENVKTSEIDITENLREELLINLPQNWSCEKNCKGLCPSCGVNLNKKKWKCKSKTFNNDTWKELDNLKF